MPHKFPTTFNADIEISHKVYQCLALMLAEWSKAPESPARTWLSRAYLTYIEQILIFQLLKHRNWIIRCSRRSSDCQPVMPNLASSLSRFLPCHAKVLNSHWNSGFLSE